MDVRVRLLCGALCLQLCACASAAQTEQNTLADAAIQNYFEDAACIQEHYAHEYRHPHACAAGVKHAKKIASPGTWSVW